MIDQILKLLRTCWPIRLVLPDQLAVWVIFGKWHKRLNPGLYFIVPAITEIYATEATEQVCDFPQMGVTTKDNIGVLFDGNISYMITDPFKALFCVSNIDLTLRSRTRGAISDIVSRRNRDECIRQDELKAHIMEELEEIEEKFGIELVQIDVTTNIKAKGIYLSR